MKFKSKFSRLSKLGLAGLKVGTELAVGKIKSLKTVEGKPLWDVEIYYSEDYRKLQNVYVIKNLMLNEQKQLEKKIPSDEEIE